MSERANRPSRSVFTDGACSGNPGRGGWAWALDDKHFASGFAEHTTNQRMEIRAAFEAVKALDGPLEVVSDSTYVVNCFKQRWWQGWLSRGWLNSQKKPVANRDLWEPFIDLVRRRGDVTFRWVKGHSGHPMNDLVDRLAVEAIENRRGRSRGIGASSDPPGAPQGKPGRSRRGEPSSPASPDPPAPAAPPTAYLVCGSTGAGKTTYAIALASEKKALRLSIDEWMKTLFLPDATEIVFEWMVERVTRCERQIQSLCEQAFRLGQDVVLDLGLSTRDHRDRVRQWVEGAGATCSVHYLDIPADLRRERVRKRNRDKDATVHAMHVTDDMFDFMEGRFEPPTSRELSGGKHVTASPARGHRRG